MRASRVTLTLLFLVLLAAPTLAADVSGSWRVTISTTDGVVRGLASLKETGDVVTGWVGPSKDDPIPVTGSVKNGRLTLKTSPQPGRTVAFDKCSLIVDGDRMSGTFEQHGSASTGTIKFVRSK